MKNPWHKVGRYYKAEVPLVYKGIHIGHSTKCYFFLTYHIVKWIHGEKFMIEMGKSPRELSEEEMNQYRERQSRIMGRTKKNKNP